jgi:multidrug efflux pump subunit AcrA (membrane-fusion protein)
MKKIFFPALVLTATLAWWFGDVPLLRDLGVQQGKAAVAPSQYLTAAVEEGELRRVVTATGTLNAIVNVEVGSQLSGQVAELLVDFNDEVRKGQPLARLDQRSFKARVAEARAAIDMGQVTIAAGKARLERARIDALDAEAQRPVLRARTDNAAVKLDSAKSELRRKETLRERSITTAVELEDTQAKVASADAALREAQAIADAQVERRRQELLRAGAVRVRVRRPVSGQRRQHRFGPRAHRCDRLSERQRCREQAVQGGLPGQSELSTRVPRSWRQHPSIRQGGRLAALFALSAPASAPQMPRPQ